MPDILDEVVETVEPDVVDQPDQPSQDTDVTSEKPWKNDVNARFADTRRAREMEEKIKTLESKNQEYESKLKKIERKALPDEYSNIDEFLEKASIFNEDDDTDEDEDDDEEIVTPPKQKKSSKSFEELANEIVEKKLTEKQKSEERKVLADKYIMSQVADTLKLLGSTEIKDIPHLYLGRLLESADKGDMDFDLVKSLKNDFGKFLPTAESKPEIDKQTIIDKSKSHAASVASHGTQTQEVLVVPPEKQKVYKAFGFSEETWLDRYRTGLKLQPRVIEQERNAHTKK